MGIHNFFALAVAFLHVKISYPQDHDDQPANFLEQMSALIAIICISNQRKACIYTCLHVMLLGDVMET